MKLKFVRAAVSLVLLFCIAGCFGGKAVQRRALARRSAFMPEIAAPEKMTKEPLFEPAKMRGCRALPPYDGRAFIVKRASGECVADFYNGWLTAPAALLRTQVERYLAGTGLFHALYDSGAGMATPLGLECVVSELLVDYSGSEPVARVRLRLLVLDELDADFRVLFSDEKSAFAKFDPEERGAVARAFDAALATALSELAEALRQSYPWAAG